MGKKKSSICKSFFFTQKHEFGWKKSFLYRNLFFHPISRFQKFQKFSKVWHENGWKKSFLFRYLFFHPVFRIQKLLYGEVGEKKDFIYKTLFSPSFKFFNFFRFCDQKSGWKKYYSIQVFFFSPRFTFFEIMMGTD